MRKPWAPGLAGAAALCALAVLAGCGGNAVAPAISVTPPSAPVTPGGRQVFFAHVDNSFDSVTRFNVLPGGAGGTLDSNEGRSFTYTAPAAATAGAVDTIRVTARDGSAPPIDVTVNVLLGVEVSPPSAEVSVGRTFQFTADVNGDAQDRVTWQVEVGGAGGTIDSAGLYTAPATAANGAVDTVRAIGVVDPTKSDTAAVVIRSGTVPVVVQ